MLKQGPKLIHWNYFLVLETDLERLSRYVEFTEDNYSTYSLEMAHLMLATCSEVDAVLKALCREVEYGNSPNSIKDYQVILTQKLPELSSMTIGIPRYGLDITPWENWQKNRTPNWWSAYNKVKHERDKYFNKAKLQYTIAALSGLFAAVLYLYKENAENGSLMPLPRLLAPPRHCIRALKQTDYGVTLVYKL